MKNFDEIYEKLQLNHSVELNNLRNKCKKRIILKKYNTLFIIVLTFLLEGLNYLFIYIDYKIVFYILTTIILLIFIYLLKQSLEYKKIKYPASEQMNQTKDENTKNYIEYFKKELIKDLIHNLNENIIYSSTNGLNEDIYIRFFEELDEKKYTKYISEDYMKLNETWIYDVSTYRNETNTIKKEYKIFSGLISISQTSNKNNFIISSKNYNIKKIKKIGKYNIYINDTELNKEIIEALNHFIDYTGSNFDLVCKDGCILIRGHFNCIFDPNIYLGHMPKKLLYTYYRNLYEFILLVNKVNENINH